jgi:hypothetical protein
VPDVIRKESAALLLKLPILLLLELLLLFELRKRKRRTEFRQHGMISLETFLKYEHRSTPAFKHPLPEDVDGQLRAALRAGAA